MVSRVVGKPRRSRGGYTAAFDPMTNWRRYPWNASAVGASLDANSATYISTWNSRGNILNPNVTTHAFSQAYYTGRPGDRKVTIEVIVYGIKTITNVPLPTWVLPSQDSDAHLVIFDPDNNREIAFWQFDEVALTAGSGDIYTPLGSDPTPGTGSNAAGFPALSLAIWPEEIAAGVIPHALAFSCVSPHVAPTNYRYPATKTDGAGDSQDLMEGMRLALPSNAFFNNAWANWVKVVWTALVNYGMFCEDKGGSLGIAGINPINGGLDWSDASVGMGSGGSQGFPGDFPWTSMNLLVQP